MSIKMAKVQMVQIGTSTHLYHLGIRYKGTHTLWCVPYVPARSCIDKNFYGGCFTARRALVPS